VLEQALEMSVAFCVGKNRLSAQFSYCSAQYW